MSVKSFISVLIVAVSTVIAANVCKIGNLINLPSNNLPYFFPARWNESQPAPPLAAEQSCSWIVTIPQGYYAKLIMDGVINDSVGYFKTVDANENVVSTTHENEHPYYFKAPKFTLIVNNEAPATFGFKIVWAQ